VEIDHREVPLLQHVHEVHLPLLLLRLPVLGDGTRRPMPPTPGRGGEPGCGRRGGSRQARRQSVEMVRHRPDQSRCRIGGVGPWRACPPPSNPWCPLKVGPDGIRPERFRPKATAGGDRWLRGRLPDEVHAPRVLQVLEGLCLAVEAGHLRPLALGPRPSRAIRTGPTNETPIPRSMTPMLVSLPLPQKYKCRYLPPPFCFACLPPSFTQYFCQRGFSIFNDSF